MIYKHIHCYSTGAFFFRLLFFVSVWISSCANKSVNRYKIGLVTAASAQTGTSAQMVQVHETFDHLLEYRRVYRFGYISPSLFYSIAFYDALMIVLQSSVKMFKTHWFNAKNACLHFTSNISETQSRCKCGQ